LNQQEKVNTLCLYVGDASSSDSGFNAILEIQ